LTDDEGSVRQLVDNTGALQDTITYDGYGNVTAETNTSFGDRYKYTGRELDTETNLQYNRARYYDAKSGRWTSQDPLGFDAGDSNLYRYVHNEPSVIEDPSGLAPASDRFILTSDAVMKIKKSLEETKKVPAPDTQNVKALIVTYYMKRSEGALSKDAATKDKAMALTSTIYRLFADHPEIDPVFAKLIRDELLLPPLAKDAPRQLTPANQTKFDTIIADFDKRFVLREKASKALEAFYDSLPPDQRMIARSLLREGAKAESEVGRRQGRLLSSIKDEFVVILPDLDPNSLPQVFDVRELYRNWLDTGPYAGRDNTARRIAIRKSVLATKPLIFENPDFSLRKGPLSGWDN
jgi:RHS repeat-associated protein